MSPETGCVIHAQISEKDSDTGHFSGNRFALRTDKPVCDNGPLNAFFQVKDPSSGRWSQRVYITYCVPID